MWHNRPQVAVDTANGRSNSTYWNSHGVDTIIIRYGLGWATSSRYDSILTQHQSDPIIARNDINRACLLYPVGATRDCTCYPLSSSSTTASTLPLPEPISNASFRESFELLGPEDFEEREVDRYGLSLTTAKKKRAGEGGGFTDSLEMTGESVCRFGWENRCGRKLLCESSE